MTAHLRAAWLRGFRDAVAGASVPRGPCGRAWGRAYFRGRDAGEAALREARP